MMMLKRFWRWLVSPVAPIDDDDDEDEIWFRAIK